MRSLARGNRIIRRNRTQRINSPARPQNVPFGLNVFYFTKLDSLGVVLLAQSFLSVVFVFRVIALKKFDITIPFKRNDVCC